MMMKNKSDGVRDLTVSGEYKKALSVVRGFRLGISKEDIEKMRLAYECIVHPEFYIQIGIDITKAVDDGIQTLVSIYGQDA